MRRALLLFFVLSFLPSLSFAYSNEAQDPGVRLMGYRPSFFLLGKPDEKLQFSFKAPVILDWHLYLAYTQLMHWDLFKNSAPFTDINYNPQIFYRFMLKEDANRWVDVGVDHESNGRDGTASRSWNRVYALYASRNQVGQETNLSWSLQAWAPFAMDVGNADIVHFRGYYELNVTLEDFLSPYLSRNDLTLRLYGGGPSGVDPTRGGQELTLRANKWKDKQAFPLLLVQLFHGYAEGLLNYNQKVTAIRGGFGF